MKDKDKKKKKKSKEGKKEIKKEKSVQMKKEAIEEKKRKKKAATEKEAGAERPVEKEAADKKAAASRKETTADKRAAEATKDRSALKNDTNGEKDINDLLIHSLRDVNHTMRALYEGKGSQKQVLVVLGKNGAMTQRALTERLGIRSGSASEVIAKLEDSGLLMRTPSREDKRTADVTLTEEGERQAAETAAQRSKQHQEMFSCLSDAEKEQLLALLETINADWAQRYRHTERRR